MECPAFILRISELAGIANGGPHKTRLGDGKRLVEQLLTAHPSSYNPSGVSTLSRQLFHDSLPPPAALFEMPEILTICERAARAGGQVLLDWVGRFATKEKGPADLVTEADLASQDQIRRILLEAFPGHGFVGEEGRERGSEAAEFRWYVDPLDGTTNYVHQIPHYCVSIGLAQHGQLACGTVFEPVSGECFTAQAGSGACLNGERISASGITQLDRAIAAVSFPPRVQRGSRAIEEFIRAIVSCQGVRRTGSTALNLCYVASGRFDAYWGSDTKSWDVAAGALIVQEAGGVITNYTGGPLDLAHPQFIAAATAPLHRELLRMLDLSKPHA